MLLLAIIATRFDFPARPILREKNLEFTAICYLNDFTDAQYNCFISDIKLSQAAGMKLSIHAPGTGSKW